jgi:hypothetical protein
MIDPRRHYGGHLVFCFVLLATARACTAQTPGSSSRASGPGTSAAGTAAPASNSVLEEQDESGGLSPLVPPAMGINFSLDVTAQHSSVTGWSNVWTPDLSYRFNSHFSVDLSFPWFLSDKAYVPVTVKGVTTNPLEQAHNVIGDTTASVNYELTHGDFGYFAVVTVGFPTGNSLYGLSANTATYNLTNHYEYSIGPFAPDVEFGEGNSSSLVNQDIKKAYTAVGPLANFQAGTWIDLPWKIGLDLEAYEALPIGNQNIYGTVTKTTKGKRTTTTTLKSTGVAEDNGFTSELDIPIAPHFVLSGAYDRSLRQHDDIVTISIAYTLRLPKKPAAK